MNDPLLIFIVGPTASGKTEVALQEAERRGASILSCDSLCVYRGMDIGTAKPTEAEQKRVAHYGIDLADSWEPYSVSRYAAYAKEVVEDHRKDGKPLIVAGGSGFYLKSFFNPVTDEIEVPPAVAEQVEHISRTGGLDGLVRALVDLHKGETDFPGLDMQNSRRVEKALIRCLASGSSYGELLAAFKSLPRPFPDWKKEVWLIERDREDMLARNRRRVDRMLSEGLIEEVRRLRKLDFERNPAASRAIGYREVLEYLDRPVPVEELAEKIFVHTNQLMRKQRTWFRRQIPVTRRLALS